MRATLLLLAVLATTALLPARVSAQDQPPSVLKSAGVTAAEVGVGLVISVAGEYGSMCPMSQAASYTVLALTPGLAAAGVCGTGAWLDRGGNLGFTILGSYAGAALGLCSGFAYRHIFESSRGFNSDLESFVSLIGFPIGCTIGSVVGHKLSRRHAVEEATRWQLVPPSTALTVKRRAAGRLVEIAGVRMNLLGARF